MKLTDEENWAECPCGHKTYIAPGHLLDWMRKRRLAREGQSS